jgi:DnaJ family protein C protein 9
VQVFEWVMCSDNKVDSHRFMDAIHSGIDRGDLKRFRIFTSWAKEVSLKPRPKNPLAKPKKRKGATTAQSDEQALVAAIR